MMSSEFWNLLSTKSLKQIPKPEEGNIKLLSENKEPIALLWLDDRINPMEQRMDWLAYSPIGRDVNVIWVKNYVDFKSWIQNNGLPGAICFDYDLGDTIGAETYVVSARSANFVATSACKVTKLRGWCYPSSHTETMEFDIWKATPTNASSATVTYSQIGS